MKESPGSSPWWDEHEVAEREGRRFTIGPLEIAIFRSTREWQLAFGPVASPDGEPDQVEMLPISSAPEEAAVVERYAVSDDRGTVRLRPIVADRSVVVRPRLPLFVPPDEQIQIFVSAPVWLRLEVGGRRETLREIPVKRLSDTWFGPSTQEGELAYSLRSHARVQLDEIPVRLYRAITPVVVENRADTMLSVDRLSLPVPYLSLFATPADHLWTERATMTRAEDGELAALKIRKGAPPEAGDARRIAEPRLVAESNVLVRAFSSLLHSFTGEER